VRFESSWIGKTVLPETVWALRSAFDLDEKSIAGVICWLVTIRGVTVEVAQGLEFADALHVASRPAGAGFRSFDQKFVERATLADVRNISTVSGR